MGSLFWLGACASVTEEKKPLMEFVVKAEYVDGQNRRIPPDYLPKQVIMHFPYIIGQIYGNPRTNPIFQIKKAIDESFRLNLKTARMIMGDNATAMTFTEDTKPLRINPTDTRIARMATFSYNAETKLPMGGGGFLDPASRDILILVYVDQPCTITGTINFPQETIEHYIELPSAGYHFLRVKKKSPGHLILTRFDEDIKEVIFSIHLIRATES